MVTDDLSQDRSARSEHSVCLTQCLSSITRINEVIERTHQQNDIEIGVRHGQLSGVPWTNLEGPLLSRSGPLPSRLKVLLDRIKEEHIEASFGKMSSVGTWPATDVEESPRWRQVSLEDVPRPETNQIPFARLPQTSILIGQLVAFKHSSVSFHRVILDDSRTRCSRGGQDHLETGCEVPLKRPVRPLAGRSGPDASGP